MARLARLVAVSLAVLALASCNQSLAVKDSVVAKVAYDSATYSLTFDSDAGGTVNYASVLVHNDEKLQITATPNPNLGWLFSGWTASPAGAATIADPANASTTVSIVGMDVAIHANFSGPTNRPWSSIASSATGQYLAATVNLFMNATSEHDSIYTSSDYGATWTRHRNSPQDMTFVSIASDGSGRYLAAAAGQGATIYTSADYGATWVARSSGLPYITSGGVDIPAADWSSIASDSTGKNLVASIADGSIYTSTDYGASWTARISPLSASPYLSFVSSSADGTSLTASDSQGEAYYSTNGGSTWKAMSGLSASGATIYATQNAAGTRFAVAISGTTGVFMNDMRPTSGNFWLWNNFTPLASAYASWSSIACDSTGQYFVGAVSGGPIVTSDTYCAGGTTHGVAAGLPSDTASWSGVCSDSSGTRLAAVVTGGHIYVSADRGVSWKLGL